MAFFFLSLDLSRAFFICCLGIGTGWMGGSVVGLRRCEMMRECVGKEEDIRSWWELVVK